MALAALPAWAGSEQPLSLSNAVIATPLGDYLADPRVFNPEFYRLFNPQLGLTTDAEATAHWRAQGAQACLRGSFSFSASDYLARYPDLAHDCLYAIQHYVTSGFNEGRIGAFEADPRVFDLYYYVANNPDLGALFGNADPVPVQLHWLQHGIAEGRDASAFFSVREYQQRYPQLSALSRLDAIRQYVVAGRAAQMFGRLNWADPAAWNTLISQRQQSTITPGPNDAVRHFTAANGKPVTVAVQSPRWYGNASAKLKTCHVNPGTDDRDALQAAFNRASLAAQDPQRCDVIELADHQNYHVDESQSDEDNHVPHLSLTNAQDFLIEGHGSTLYFNRQATGIDVFQSARGILRGITIDWESPLNKTAPGPLYSALGTIVVSKGVAHVQLDADTPFPPGFTPYLYAMNLWDRQRGQYANDDYLNTGPGDLACDAGCQANHGAGSQQSTYLSHSGIYPNLASKNPNDAAVAAWVNQQFLAWPGRTVMLRFADGYPEVAIQVDYGTNDLRLIDNTIHASPYMGVTGGQGQRGIAVENITITPSQGRYISTMADGLHFTAVNSDILIDGGTIEGPGDDAINVTNSWDAITALDTSGSNGCSGSGSCFDMNGSDIPPQQGDVYAFFDPALGFLGSAVAESFGTAGLYGGPVTGIQLDRKLGWLKAGDYAMNMNHVPARFYISGLAIRRKLGHGIIVGGMHGLIQDSSISDITSSAIVFDFSSYWTSSVGGSDIAIRNNRFVGTNYVPEFYEDSVGTAAYPHANAAISMFSDVVTNEPVIVGAPPAINVTDDALGTYPRFQDNEISGNTLQSLSGAGIYAIGTRNLTISDNHVIGCAASTPDLTVVSDQAYFGSASRSAVVLSYADNVSMPRNFVASGSGCSARFDAGSSRNVGL